MKLHRLLISIIVLQLSACNSDEIEFFDDNNYIFFGVEADDENIITQYETSFSFTFSDETVREKDWTVPVTYAGRFLDNDKMFSFKVVDSLTTAIEDKHFRFPDASSQVIKANETSGNALITLLRTEDMLSETFDIVLQLVENENFKVGHLDIVRITVTDQLIKPEWWEARPHTSFLGNYSQMKLRLWLEFMGVEDGSDPWDTDVYYYWTDRGTGNYIYKTFRDGATKSSVLAFKTWLRDEKGNPYDEELNSFIIESLGTSY